MAIELPRQIVDLGKGADLGMAGKLGMLKNGIAAKSAVVTQITGMLNDLNTLQNSTGLPDFPTPLDIQGQAANIQGLVNVQLQTLESLPGGACIGSSLGSLTSIASDGYGFISKQMDALTIPNVAEGFLGMPQELMDISSLFSQGREFVGSLGLDKYVNQAIGTLGCLVDDTAAVGELESIMGQLGMDYDPQSITYGTVTPASYAQSMSDQLAATIDTMTAEIPGFNLDPSYIQDAIPSLGTMSEMANDFAGQAKAKAAEQTAALKGAIVNNIPPLPAPPSIV